MFAYYLDFCRSNKAGYVSGSKAGMPPAWLVVFHPASI